MLDASSVSIAGEVGVRGRADSPTKAGGNYENLEIMSITGHRTLEEVERYTRAAQQSKLADSAMAKLKGRR
jgi:hypothetical protein